MGRDRLAAHMAYSPISSVALKTQCAAMLPPRWPVANRRAPNRIPPMNTAANAPTRPRVASGGSAWRFVSAMVRVTVTPCQSVNGAADKTTAQGAAQRRGRRPGSRELDVHPSFDQPLCVRDVLIDGQVLRADRDVGRGRPARSVMRAAAV